MTVATVLLVLGIVSMISLLWLKHWELTRGRTLFSGARGAIRARLGAISKEGGFFSGAVADVAGWSARLSRSITRSAAARALIALERSLERMLHAVRRNSTKIDRPDAPSPFLQEVAEYKKKLARPRLSRLRSLGE